MKKFICQVCLFIAFFTFFEIASYAQNILEPGVSYVARQYVKNGHAFGISGPEYHSVEIKIYKDGTASGIYSVGLHDYDEDGSQMLKLTGDWSNTSKYDRKVIDIFLKYEDEFNYESFHIYVDENQNAYLRDLNNSPAQLYKKSDLIAEKEKANAEDAKREEEEEKFTKEIKEQYFSLMTQSKAFYEIIDLGLSVKWANVNLILAFFDDGYWGKSWLFDGGNLEYAQLDVIGSLYKSKKSYDHIERTNSDWMYARNEEGKVIIRPYYDPYMEYVAGGSKHGYPVKSDQGDKVKKALLLYLKYNPDPSLSTSQDQEIWAKAYQNSQHYPTKAEWQELIDNCIVTGVETNPVRNNPIYLDFNFNVFHLGNYYSVRFRDDDEKEELLRLGNVKMLRLTSKINGKSIVLPFDSQTGTNYATSQFLSSNPDEMTCVHVDSNGLSFLEVNRDSSIAQRLVFGDINMASLESDIQAAQAKYPSSPFVLEQKQLRDEYEEQHTDGMLSIGTPSITVKNNGSSRRLYEIKAPIISGRITGNSRVTIAIQTDKDKYTFYDKCKIYHADKSTTAYVMYTGDVDDKKNERGDLIKQHSVSVYFISDNTDSNDGGEEINSSTYDFLKKYHDHERGYIQKESDLIGFLKSFNYDGIEHVKEHGFNNAYDKKTSRRLIVTPATYFSINGNNTIKYESGPVPSPIVGTPKVLNIGTFKKGTFSNVEIGFDVVESDYPFEHPQTQSFNLGIKTGDQVIKTKYAETVDNNRKYIVKKLTAGIPYTLTGYIIDQYGIKYESSETITLNADGTVSTVTKK